MLICKQCGHYSDEYRLEYRSYCRGCGITPKDNTEESWNEFLDKFDEVDDDCWVY